MKQVRNRSYFKCERNRVFMDRTGKKKVTAYIIISICFLLVCGLLHYETARTQYDAQIAGMMELVSEYPKAETSIVGSWREARKKTEEEIQKFRKPYGYTFYNTTQRVSDC